MTEKVTMAESASQPFSLFVKGFYGANFLTERNAGLSRPCAMTAVGGAHD